ncbi:MAG: alpha/beta hydrolase [Gammaproteobacteria bacterium]|nr:alpha/beta hydrolase [Gammaproteobacteria bacterium]
MRGVDYNCTVWGNSDDPLLVLLHGWGDAGSSFQFVADALPDDWRIVAPDWRGFGDTRHRAEAYWFPDYLADLDVLLDLLSPRDPVHLVGHSMGANIVGLYAGVMPERVKSFVNVEGFGLSERDPAGAPDNYRRWLQQARDRPVFAEYSRFEELVPRILHRSPRMGRDKARFVARLWAQQDPDGRVRLKADPSHKLPNAVLYRRAEAEACWERVEAPVLLVVGADTQFDVARDWLAAGTAALPFPNAEVRGIDGAGHMVHFEQPEALAATIESFIRPRL